VLFGCNFWGMWVFPNLTAPSGQEELNLARRLEKVKAIDKFIPLSRLR